MTVAPGSPPRMRAKASWFRWKRPQSLYPQFEALCAMWDELKPGVYVLARNAISEGQMTPYDAMHFRECFRRVANRYELYAGLQYNTYLYGYTLMLVKHDKAPGYPRLEVDSATRAYATTALEIGVKRA